MVKYLLRFTWDLSAAVYKLTVLGNVVYLICECLHHFYSHYCISCDIFYQPHLQVKWIGHEKELETWEPECNMLKAMVDDFERKEHGPSGFVNKIDKKYRLTTVTNFNVQVDTERNAKSMKTDHMSPLEG